MKSLKLELVIQSSEFKQRQRKIQGWSKYRKASSFLSKTHNSIASPIPWGPSILYKQKHEVDTNFKTAFSLFLVHSSI